MAKARQQETLTVDERPDGVFIEMSEGKDRVEDKWTMTLEHLHSTLERLGWHRCKKQDGSQIGGEYTR